MVGSLSDCVGDHVSFSDRLVDKVPRESSGGRTSNRFGFQHDWTLCLLLELHAEKEDYLVICEFHDDAIVLDSESAPTAARFYQVKTEATGVWTIKKLLKRKAGKTGLLPSILGRLVASRVTFPEADRLSFVSNARLKTKLTSGLPSTEELDICFSELSASEVKEVKQALEAEHGIELDDPATACIHFEVTVLSLLDHENNTVGRLGTFLEKVHPKFKGVRPALYRSLVAEVRRRADREGRSKTFDELRKTKGIGRSDFQAMLDTAAATTDLDALWLIAQQRLQHEAVPLAEQVTVHTAWQRIEIDRMDSSNALLALTRRKVQQLIRAAVKATPAITLAGLWSAVTDGLYGPTRKIAAYPDDYVRAMTCMELYENGEFSASVAEPEEET